MAKLRMKKNTIKKIEKIADELGWMCCGSSDYDDWRFSIGSPEGRDCNIELNADDLDTLKESLQDYVDGYDVSYESYLWLDNTGHGTNGAPYDMRDCYNDMEWFRDKARELADKIKEVSE